MDGPATEITIITRSETAMQAAAIQTSRRVDPATVKFRLLTVFTPQVDASNFGQLPDGRLFQPTV
jgi:hypothetical protein